MFEILFIIFIFVAISNAKKKMQNPGRPKTPPTPVYKPPVSTPARPRKPDAPRPEKLTREQTEQLKREKRAKLNQGKAKPEPRTFIEPSKAYRPAHNAAERYEEWMPLPESKEVLHCSYCGADNLIPKHQRASLYTCYFCREELH